MASASLPLAGSEISPTHAQKKNYESEQSQIESEVSGEVPVLACMTKATTRDVQSPHFCGDGCDYENGDERY
jgi:hypothetical protein